MFFNKNLIYLGQGNRRNYECFNTYSSVLDVSGVKYAKTKTKFDCFLECKI